MGCHLLQGLDVDEEIEDGGYRLLSPFPGNVLHACYRKLSQQSHEGGIIVSDHMTPSLQLSSFCLCAPPHFLEFL